jgi:hypothetical protein
MHECLLAFIELLTTRTNLRKNVLRLRISVLTSAPGFTGQVTVNWNF